jgi:aldehyde:ferredoxin oxidoreductase
VSHPVAHGFWGKMLDIDLTTGAIGIYQVPDAWLRLFLGGKGLAARILFDLLPPGVDPLGPENVLIFTPGCLTGSGAPCTGRYNLSTKNVLTGGIASSNCGGSFGTFIKRAGYDGLIVRGKAAAPVYLDIRDDEAQIKDARHLWGLETPAAQNKLETKKLAGVIVIGPAGENLVRFAGIMDGHRTLGRTGVGAVMGSKLLKAIRISGAHRLKAYDKRTFNRVVKDWTKLLKGNPTTGQQVPRYGTAGLVNLANATYTLPVRNFSTGHDRRADEVSGETMAETILTRNSGCISCPIRCTRNIKLDDIETKGVEFETLGMFGPNIGNFDQVVLARLGKRCDELGMDTISAGSTLAFAMELTERKMLQSDLAFGSTENLLQVLDDIAYRRGLGDDLAEGSARMSQKYGGAEFAMHAKGLEFAAYEPRGAVGHGLGYAVSNRGGCHINGGYLVFFEALGPVQIDPLTPLAKPALTVFQQNVFDAVASCGNCIFTTYAVIPGGVEKVMSLHGSTARAVSGVLKGSRLLLNHQGRMRSWMLPLQLPVIPQSKAVASFTGHPCTLGEFVLAGERCYTIERLFNLREGHTAKDDYLPKRLTDELQRPSVPGSKVPLYEMLPVYYEVRDWDQDGVPRARLLKKLGLADLLPVLDGLKHEKPATAFSTTGRYHSEHDAKLAHHRAEIRAVTEALEGQRQELDRELEHAESVLWAKKVQVRVFTIDAGACERCGECYKVCPHEAITWSPGNVAKIDPPKCVNCGLCYKACPPYFDAVRMPAAPPASLPRPRYRVDEPKCEKCGICPRKCPVKCIAWARGKVAIIDEEACVRCDICHEVCPTRFDAILRIPEAKTRPAQAVVTSAPNP